MTHVSCVNPIEKCLFSNTFISCIYSLASDSTAQANGAIEQLCAIQNIPVISARVNN